MVTLHNASDKIAQYKISTTVNFGALIMNEANSYSSVTHNKKNLSLIVVTNKKAEINTKRSIVDISTIVRS